MPIYYTFQPVIIMDELTVLLLKTDPFTCTLGLIPSYWLQDIFMVISFSFMNHQFTSSVWVWSLFIDRLLFLLSDTKPFFTLKISLPATAHFFPLNSKHFQIVAYVCLYLLSTIPFPIPSWIHSIDTFTSYPLNFPSSKLPCTFLMLCPGVNS